MAAPSGTWVGPQTASDYYDAMSAPPSPRLAPSAPVATAAPPSPAPAATWTGPKTAQDYGKAMFGPPASPAAPDASKPGLFERLNTDAVAAEQSRADVNQAIKGGDKSRQLEAVGKAFPQSFGDFAVNYTPLGGLIKFQAENDKAMRIQQDLVEAHPEFGTQIQGDGPLHSWLKNITQGIAETGVEGMETGAVFSGFDFQTAQNLAAAARINMGLPPQQRFSSTTDALSHLWDETKNHIFAVGNTFVDMGKKMWMIATEPDQMKKDEMMAQYTQDVFDGMTNAASLGIAGQAQKFLGYSQDGKNVYYKGVAIRELNPEQQKVAGAGKTIGGIAGSAVVWTSLAPWLGKGVVSTFPALEPFAVAHPYLFQISAVNGAQQLFQNVVAKGVGAPYNFADTVTGLMMNAAFSTVGAAKSGITGTPYDPLGFVKGADAQAAAEQADTFIKGFVNENGRVPSAPELQQGLGNETIPGTDKTWNDMHEYAAKTFGSEISENRMLSFKGEGRPGIEEPAAPPSRFEGDQGPKWQRFPTDEGDELLTKSGNVYRAMSQEEFDAAQQSGQFTPSTPESPGAAGRKYFSADPEGAKMFGSLNEGGTGGNDVLVRVKADDLPDLHTDPHPLANTGKGVTSIFTEQPVPTGATEFSTDGGKTWQPTSAQSSPLEGASPVQSGVGESRFAYLKGSKQGGNVPPSDDTPDEPQMSEQPIPPPQTPEEARQVVDSIDNTGDRVPQVFRTDKFNVDEAAQGKLKEVQSALGMETRDVRHWSDVEDMAKEFGRDPVSMLKAIKGNRSLTDVEVQGLRDTIKVASDYLGNKYDMIDEATKAGDSAKVDQITTRADQYEQILNDATKKLIGGGTEAGRAVAIYRNIAQTKMDDPSYWYKEAASLIEGRSSARFTGADGEMTSTKIEDGNIPEDLRTAIDSLMKTKDQVGLAYLMSQLKGSTNVDKVIGLWKAGLLSNLMTHAAKMASELTFRSLETAKDVPATIIDKLLSTVTGDSTKTFSPLKYQQLLSGMAEGAKEMRGYFKTGVDPYGIVSGDLSAPFETHYDNPIAEMFTQSVFRALGSETLPYKFAAFRQSLAEQSITSVNNMDEGELNTTLSDLSDTLGHDATKEELIQYRMQKPDDAMVKQAIDETAYQTFSGDNALSRGLRGFEQASPTAKPAMQFLLPFRKFPTNMAIAAVDYSPVGFLKTLVSQLSNGFDQKQLSEGFGRAITGTAIMALGTKLAADGKLTGPLPTNPSEQALWTSAHKQPNSVMIGGKWRSIDRFSVIGALLTTGAVFNDLRNKNNLLGTITETAAGGAKQLIATTPLLGLSSALNALNDPTRYAGTWVDNALRGLVPNIIGRLAQGVDPMQRRPDKYDITQILENRIPLLSEKVPAKQDIFGRDMPNHAGVISQLFDFTHPTTPAKDPVINELMRLDAPIPTPAQNFYTPAEHRDLMKMKGQMLYPLLNSFMTQGGDNYEKYQGLNDEQKKAAVSSMDQAASQFAEVHEKATAAPRIAKELQGMSEKERTATMTKIMKQDRTLYEFILRQPKQ